MTDSEYKEILLGILKLRDAAMAKDQKQYGFYQLCPKCDGEKEVQLAETSKPMFGTCPLCNGEGKLVRPEIKPGE